MKVLYSVILLFFLTSNAICQQSSFSQAQLDSLYAERLQLSANNEDYSQIELRILQSGIYPSALVEKTVEGQGNRYKFKTYSPISGSGNQESMENRFRSMFPEIQFIEIRDEKVDVILSPQITSENLDLFFFYLGYKNIQLKN